MKRKGLFLLLGGLLLLLGACNPRVEGTQTAGVPAGPPAPTRGVAPTAPPTAPQTAGPTAPPPTAPAALTAPRFTEQGRLENGIAYGVTGDGQHFLGDPKAPLLIFEFSDFQ